MSDSNYAPGVYVKGSDVRVVDKPSEAVALVFAGYVRQAADDVKVDETPTSKPPVPVTPSAPVPDPAPTPRDLARPTPPSQFTDKERTQS